MWTPMLKKTAILVPREWTLCTPNYSVDLCGTEGFLLYGGEGVERDSRPRRPSARAIWRAPCRGWAASRTRICPARWRRVPTSSWCRGPRTRTPGCPGSRPSTGSGGRGGSCPGRTPTRPSRGTRRNAARRKGRLKKKRTHTHTVSKQVWKGFNPFRVRERKHCLFELEIMCALKTGPILTQGCRDLTELVFNLILVI